MKLNDRTRTISFCLIVVLLLGMAAVWAYYYFFSTVKLGFSAGLSGLKSELGISGRNGALLAVEDLNRKGGIRGKKIELLVADDKNDPQAAQDADRRLMDKGVHVIIGHMVSGVAKATLEHADIRKALFISPTIASEELTAIDDNFIRVIASNTVQGYSLAKTALQETAVRRVAVIYDEKNASFAKPIHKAFQTEFENNGGEIVLAAAFQKQEEFKKIISAVRTSGADGILLIASALDAGMFCQQGRKSELKVPIFSPMWTMTNDFIQAGGTDSEGAYLISQTDLENDSLLYRRFQQLYQERFGENPTFASILSYDAVIIATAAIQEARSDSPMEVKEALLRIGKFSGLQGIIQIDNYGDVESGYYLHRVKNGKFKKERRL